MSSVDVGSKCCERPCCAGSGPWASDGAPAPATPSRPPVRPLTEGFQLRSSRASQLHDCELVNASCLKLCVCANYILEIKLIEKVIAEGKCFAQGGGVWAAFSEGSSGHLPGNGPQARRAPCEATARVQEQHGAGSAWHGSGKLFDMYLDYFKS